MHCGCSESGFRWIERSVARCFIVAASPHFFWHRAAERAIHHAQLALCHVLGATIGARLAIAKGSRFVRIFFLVVVCALIAKLAQSIFAP